MKGIIDTPELKDKFLKSFQLVKSSPIHAIQQEAISIFEATGFPSTKNEDWKYTNAEPLLKKPFNVIQQSEVANPTLKENIKTFFIPNLDCYRLVFVNGFYNA